MQDLLTFLSHHATLAGSLAALFILLIIVEFLRAKQSSIQLSPIEATHKINHDRAVMIDISPKERYRQGHIIDAQSITTTELTTATKKFEKWRSKPVIFICQNGLESQKMAARFLKDGFNAYSISGGMLAWQNAKMPVIKEAS